MHGGDGVERADGVLLFVTTNLLETVDDALRHRPGRIDQVVEFEYPDEDGRAAIAERFVGPERARQIAIAHPDASPARIVEVCTREAVSEYFGGAAAATGAGAGEPELRPIIPPKRR